MKKLVSDDYLCALVSAVALQQRVALREIMSSRRGNVSRARHLATYVIKKYTGWSLPAVGAMFNKDHTSVLYGCQRVEGKYFTPEQLVDVLTHVKALADELVTGKSEVDAVAAVARVHEKFSSHRRPGIKKKLQWEWLQEDDDYVIENYDKFLHSDIAKDLGCSLYELSKRKVYLRNNGLIGKSRQRGSAGNERVRQRVDWRPNDPGRPWSKEEDGVVIADAFGNVPPRETAVRMVGRSRCAVIARRRRLEEGGILQCETKPKKGRPSNDGAQFVGSSLEGRRSPSSPSNSMRG